MTFSMKVKYYCESHTENFGYYRRDFTNFTKDAYAKTCSKLASTPDDSSEDTSVETIGILCSFSKF